MDDETHHGNQGRNLTCKSPSKDPLYQIIYGSTGFKGICLFSVGIFLSSELQCSSERTLNQSLF